MKTKANCFISLITLMSLIGVGSLRAQEPPADNVQGEVDKNQAQAEKEIRRAREQLDQAQTRFAQVPQTPQTPQPPHPPGTSFQTRLQNIINRSVNPAPMPGMSSTLVIRSTDSSPAQQANLEEDLAVMSHLLTKAIEENVGGPSRPANVLGIDVGFAPGAGSVRSLYLEGYGALFLLNVDFPLLPPPASNAHKEPAGGGSAWEAARRELYGAPPDGTSAPGFNKAYDEEKVAKLKSTLLDSVKNASNIRGLKDNEMVTVCVIGEAGRGQVRFKALTNGSGGGGGSFGRPIGGGGGGWGESVETRSLPAHQSVLTLRAKKADVDAFAAGKLTPNDFQKRAQMTIYTVSGEGTEAMRFGGGGGGGGE